MHRRFRFGVFVNKPFIRRKSAALLVCSILFTLLPFNSFASPTDTEPEKNLSIGFWFGYSPFSNTILARIDEAKLVLAGLDVTHTSFNIQNISIRASSQLIIFGMTDFPKNGQSGPRDQRSGIGLIPLKATIPLINSTNSFPYLSAGIGFMFFSQRFPNNEGTQFNATIEAGAGYQTRLTEQLSLDIGYRFHHMSNGQTGQVNPGIDSNLFTATLNVKF